VDHCAIDLGGRESQICIRSCDEKILKEARWKTRDIGEHLGKLAPMRVVMETCAEAFGIADAALAAGHQVRVVPATLVTALGVGSRQVKTDKKDARLLSEVSCRIDLPSVHVPSARSREWKSFCGMRDALVSSRTKVINNLRGWLRGQAIQLPRGSAETFQTRLRAAQLESRPGYLEFQLVSLDTLTAQIKLADKEQEKLAESEPVCQRLMTVPGVGPVTAVRFVSALDEISRFRGEPHKVESYLGLVPGESSSSESKQRLSITKAGSPSLRWVLVQAAWALRNSRLANARPLQRWAMDIEKRRGPRIATVALARKLAGILFALWKDGTTFDPGKGTTTTPG
jgi:transposase